MTETATVHRTQMVIGAAAILGVHGRELTIMLESCDLWHVASALAAASTVMAEKSSPPSHPLDWRAAWADHVRLTERRRRDAVKSRRDRTKSDGRL